MKYSKILMMVAVTLAAMVIATGCASSVKQFRSEGIPNFKINLSTEAGLFSSASMKIRFYENLPGCKFRDLGMLTVKDKTPFEIALPANKLISFFPQLDTSGWFSPDVSVSYEEFFFTVKPNEVYEYELIHEDGSLTQTLSAVKNGKKSELENNAVACKEFKEVTE